MANSSNNRRELRLIAVICVYQALLLKKDVKDCLSNYCNKPFEDIDSFLQTLVVNAMTDIKVASGNIEEKLNKDWKFERLAYLEQAILLIAYGEVKIAKTQKAIVINEAIEIAKLYVDVKSYKFINKVLDDLSC